MTKQIKNTHYLILLMLLFATTANAQTVDNESQTRTSITIGTKLFKNIKVSLSPELRFDENFSLDKSLIEAKASYEVFNNLSIGAGFRFYANERDEKSTEYYNRYLLSAEYAKSFGRFKPSLKISYTNFSYDDEDDTFLRYKAEVKYNIRKSKFTPYIGLELFQETGENELYKTRYFAGTDYKLFKNNSIEASYKFDYLQNEFKNKHIISISYKLKF